MPKKVAIVYDWADTRFGGAEKVLVSLASLYHEATLFVAYREPEAEWTNAFHEVRVSPLQRWPRFWRQHKSWLAVFLPWAFEQFDFTGFDLIISVTSFAAKGILTKPNQLHVCYLLTPTRFLFSHEHEYLPRQGFLVRTIAQQLRRWDKAAIWRPDRVIAISRLVATRCQEYYGRACEAVVYPTLLPSELPQFCDDEKLDLKLPEKIFLCVGRWRAYKRLDLVVEICARKGFNLVCVGAGASQHVLEKQITRDIRQNIYLLQNATQKALQVYYNKAVALIAPGLEDFGINLLEANQVGTLVVTHPGSGARELLSDDQVIDLDPQDLAGSLEAVLVELDANAKRKVSVQSLREQDFKKAWLEKIERYEQEVSGKQ